MLVQKCLSRVSALSLVMNKMFRIQGNITNKHYMKLCRFQNIFNTNATVIIVTLAVRTLCT